MTTKNNNNNGNSKKYNSNPNRNKMLESVLIDWAQNCLRLESLEGTESPTGELYKKRYINEDTIAPSEKCNDMISRLLPFVADNIADWLIQVMNGSMLYKDQIYGFERSVYEGQGFIALVISILHDSDTYLVSEEQQTKRKQRNAVMQYIAELENNEETPEE